MGVLAIIGLCCLICLAVVSLFPEERISRPSIADIKQTMLDEGCSYIGITSSGNRIGCITEVDVVIVETRKNTPHIDVKYNVK